MVDKNILDHYTNLPVGEVLKRARTETGMEVFDVSRRLNIRPEHLAAIEDNDASRLPPRVYAIGFVRTYADFLGLDADKMVYLFKSQCIGHTTSKALYFPTPVSESRAPAPWIVGVSIAAVIAAVGGWYVFSDRGAPVRTTPDVPPAMAVMPAKEVATDEQTAAAASAAAASAAPAAATAQADGKTFGVAADKAKFKIIAAEASWIELREAANPKNILFNRVLNKGEAYYAPATPALTLNTGNAEGIQILVDGKLSKILDDREGVVRDLPLSARGGR